MFKSRACFVCNSVASKGKTTNNFKKEVVLENGNKNIKGNFLKLSHVCGRGKSSRLEEYGTSWITVLFISVQVEKRNERIYLMSKVCESSLDKRNKILSRVLVCCYVNNYNAVVENVYWVPAVLGRIFCRLHEKGKKRFDAS